MAEEIIKILRRKHSFLSAMIEGVEYAMKELEEESKPEKIYSTLTVFLGEFPTKKLIQDLADENGIEVRVRTKEDALTVLRSLREI
ncbi:hypothetical protein [Thermococcus sp. JdF3]|uniref:hypothetical protein n=1 Tax=Thermococcus sp. JdF3 TaxID=1638258 RepID=UPI00143C66F1|nr:hypothetical protein [Thermococcus sp. JdF3]NJE00745.1 hypothetical protein [Thermococcus sp. JdF3]